MSDVLPAVGLAAVMLLFGVWGRRNVAGLVPRSLSAYGQRKWERELRRGTTLVIGIAVLILLGVMVRLVTPHVG